MLFVGKGSKTWYFQKDVAGHTRRVLIGRFPLISAQTALQNATSAKDLKLRMQGMSVS